MHCIKYEIVGHEQRVGDNTYVCPAPNPERLLLRPQVLLVREGQPDWQNLAQPTIQFTLLADAAPLRKGAAAAAKQPDNIRGQNHTTRGTSLKGALKQPRKKTTAEKLVA